MTAEAHTVIHLNEAFTRDEEQPTIPVNLHAHTTLSKPAVSIGIGEIARGQFCVMVTPRSARHLAHYLLAFADTADGVPVREGDPTVDAPELIDTDAPDFTVEKTCPNCGGELVIDDTSNVVYCQDDPDHYRSDVAEVAA